MNAVLGKLLLSALLTPCVKGGFSLLGLSVAWWIAAAIGLVVVFGGWLIIGNSDGA